MEIYGLFKVWQCDTINWNPIHIANTQFQKIHSFEQIQNIDHANVWSCEAFDIWICEKISMYCESKTGNSHVIVVFSLFLLNELAALANIDMPPYPIFECFLQIAVLSEEDSFKITNFLNNTIRWILDIGDLCENKTSHYGEQKLSNIKNH